MRNYLRTSLLSFAAALALGPGALAGVTYKGWVNGFGFGRIDYTLTCSNGQVIVGSSTTTPGARACADGSNTLNWGWGAFWQWNVNVVDNKSVQGHHNSSRTGGLSPTGDVFHLTGSVNRSAPGYRTQLAVLTVPGEVLPDDVMLVEELLIQGFLQPEDIAFILELDQGVLNFPLDEIIPLNGVYNEQEVIVLEVTTSQVLDANSYCQANANSTGSPAFLQALGSTSLLANDLSVVAAPVPNQFGVFFHGPQQTQIPFGNGFRCVGGSVVRLDVLSVTGNTAYQPLDLQGPGLGLGPVNMQFWYRDPAAGGAAFNLSDALHLLITF